MFSPEMLSAARNMMSTMKPEDMKRMSDMAANMDPAVMENMMKGMGGNAPSGNDIKKMSEQMKNMSPEQLRAQMNQAQTQMDAQKQYVMNGANVIKNEGNDLIRRGEYSEALKSYDRALENLKPHAGEDVKQLRLSLLLNTALCHLKLKGYQKSIDTCEEALTINAQSVKAIFRRGLARFELGMLSQAVADVKRAHELSPEDKTVASELTRLQTECIDRGVKEEDIAAAARAEEKKAAAAAAAPATPGAPRSFAPGGSSGGGNTGSSGTDNNFAEAMDALSKNPEMLDQATEAMKNMSSEDLQRMMKDHPLPPGVDPEMMRKNMEAMKKNPEMLKLLAKQGGGSGGAPPNPKDFASMSKAFEDPEMMKQISEMAKTMGSDGDPGEADMMRKAAETLSSNPELGSTMSNMMKNMPPEQLQKMMEMSSTMMAKRKAGGDQSSSGMAPGGMDAASMDSFMNDPEMMKAAEDMMKSMSPETLAAMARSSGIEMDENQAKMLGKVMPFVPWIMKGMRGFHHVKKGVKSAFSQRGRIIIAVVVLVAALIQHWRSS